MIGKARPLPALDDVWDRGRHGATCWLVLRESERRLALLAASGRLEGEGRWSERFDEARQSMVMANLVMIPCASWTSGGLEKR